MSESVNEKMGSTHTLNNSSTHLLTGRENIYFNGAILGITISLLGVFRWANERDSLKYEDGNLL